MHVEIWVGLMGGAKNVQVKQWVGRELLLLGGYR